MCGFYQRITNGGTRLSYVKIVPPNNFNHLANIVVYVINVAIDDMKGSICKFWDLLFLKDNCIFFFILNLDFAYKE